MEIQDKGWAISDELYRFITDLLPQNSTILELGSGEGTGLLANTYEMVSVEHNKKYLGLYRSRYIHAPIRPFAKQCAVFPEDQGWYDRDVLKRELAKVSYDLILVDGPPSNIGRGGFYKWRHFFRTDVPIVFDDAHRAREARLIMRMSAFLQRPYTIYAAWTPRHFGVIQP